MNRLPPTHNFVDSTVLPKLSKPQLSSLDTLISHNVLRGLNHKLRQSPIWTFGFPIWYTERQSDLLASSNDKLTKREVNDLCRAHGTDAVVSLESCLLLASPDGYTYFQDKLTPILRARLNTGWTIYLPGNPRPYFEYHTTDTLYYALRGTDRLVSEMIRKVSYQSGSKFGRVLTPVWAKEERNLYARGSRDLRKGSQYTAEGDWEKAYDRWLVQSASKRDKNRAKALYNLAVYYELEDNLDSAWHCITKSVSSDSLDLIVSYKKELDTRLKNKQTIGNQVIRSEYGGR
jgi:hypothetical protein